MTLRIDDDQALDLVIRGGRVLDAGSGLDARLDVGVRYGRIAAIGPDLSDRIAERRMQMPLDLGTLVIDATDRIVAPGFIDLHTHVFVGVCGLTVPADEISSTTGVTTCVSAGDAGAHTIEAFRRLAVEANRTRVLAFLHVSNVGLAPWPAGEATDLDMLDVPAGIRAARENPDIVIGVKVRMTAPQVIRDHDLEPLRRAIAIGEGAGIPVIMHIGYCPRPIGELLELMRPGDIVTHCFTGSDNTLVEDGRLGRGVHEARARGVLFDVGHGSGSFSYRVADIAIAEGFWPDTISTDIHSLSAAGPVYDLPTTMSKFLALGMPLSRVIESVTSRPAAAIGRSSPIGAIGLGRTADLTVFDVEEGDFTFRDSGAQQSGVRTDRHASARIRIRNTIRAGIPWQAPLPHPGRGVGLAPD
ncbi:MAG TPA: amidohydrolase/deacetylase family metallohydrolase [Candidatus Limnocylindria bacterium]|nr:amidohydrolase/deacetylase family metallohydrolase [Candidatus Limnocylindria bacterium]